MPIPPLSAEGWLPDGIHECTVDEIVDRFGQFQRSDRRLRLAEQLVEYLNELRGTNIARYLIVDGSFVTARAEPGDIDLLLVLRDDIDLASPVPPFRYNPRSKKYVRRRFEFDFAFGWEGDPTTTEYLALYRKVKERPGEVKGVLKVIL